MKNSQFRLVLICISILIGVMLTSIASAQTNRFDIPAESVIKQNEYVRVSVKVYLNNKYVETDAIKIRCTNSDYDVDYKTYTNNDFSIFLDRFTKYSILITCKDFNTNSFDIVTNVPYDKQFTLDLDIYLYTNKPDIYEGTMVYNMKEERYNIIQ